MAAPVIAAALAAGGSILGQGINAYTQSRINKQNIAFAREQYSRQREDALADWHMQNQYNSPLAQMERLKEAGLNPHLVYGSGADATTKNMPRGATSHMPNLRAPEFDLGSVVNMALGTQQIKANIARTEAETERIKADTASGVFDLEVKRAVGVDRMAKELNAKVTSVTTRAAREVREFEAFMDVAFDNTSNELRVDQFGTYATSGNDLIRKALKAGLEKTVVDLQNLRKAGQLRDDQHTLNKIQMRIADFRAALAEYGISPESAQGLTVIVSILKSIFGK